MKHLLALLFFLIITPGLAAAQAAPVAPGGNAEHQVIAALARHMVAGDTAAVAEFIGKNSADGASARVLSAIRGVMRDIAATPHQLGSIEGSPMGAAVTLRPKAGGDVSGFMVVMQGMKLVDIALPTRR